MKNHLVFLLAIVVAGNFLCSDQALSSESNFNQKKSKKILIEEPLSFPALGEFLVFEVSWMGIPVGFGELEVKEKTTVHGREVYHLVAVAKTNDFLSKIYPVRDEVHSWVDVKTLHSLAFQKTLSEGRYRADEKIYFDEDKRMGFYESFLNHSKKEFEIEVPVHDILSVFYWFRAQPVAVGVGHKTRVNSEEKSWDLELKILKLETLELRGNKPQEAILVEPITRLKGVLYKRGRVWVHFSVDKSRTPLRITFKTPFGPVVGVLKSTNVLLSD